MYNPHKGPNRASQGHAYFVSVVQTPEPVLHLPLCILPGPLVRRLPHTFPHPESAPPFLATEDIISRKTGVIISNQEDLESSFLEASPLLAGIQI